MRSQLKAVLPGSKIVLAKISMLFLPQKNNVVTLRNSLLNTRGLLKTPSRAVVVCCLYTDPRCSQCDAGLFADNASYIRYYKPQFFFIPGAAVKTLAKTKFCVLFWSCHVIFFWM